MADAPPHAIFLAGPKGAGKSTAAPSLLRDYLGVTEYINADVIAAGLSAFRPESAALHASAVLLERIEDLVEQQRSFAVETTLASKSYAPRIRRWQQQGYRVDLHFLWLRSVEIAIERVAARVQIGGHEIPESTIRRRYTRGLVNFREKYSCIVDRWVVYDASSASGSDPIAKMESGVADVISSVGWQHFEEFQA